MRKAIMTVAATVMLTGCAGPMPKKSADLKLAAPPTKEESMRKIMSFLNDTLIDPDSAKVSCTHIPTPGWIWPGYGYDIKYGYMSVCNVNAKNRFGGYAGGKRYVFRINGDEFEYHDIVPKMGVVDDK